MKKDFITSVNNANKMYPPLYLKLEEIQTEGCIVLHVYVSSENRSAGIMVKFLTGAMRQIWISQIMPMPFTSCMQENRTVIM